MKNFPIQISNNTINIEGIPDAVKLIKLTCKKSQSLADFALHNHDMKFAAQYLNQVVNSNNLVKKALWRSAINLYVKCFRPSKARGQLDSKIILRGNQDALRAHNYFYKLRNKHIEHDENNYAQCIVMAALNDGSKNYKVEKIVCSINIALVLNQANFDNLNLLIKDTLKYIQFEFDKLAKIITDNLENKSYEELNKQESIIYKVPTAEEVEYDRGRIF